MFFAHQVDGAAAEAAAGHASAAESRQAFGGVDHGVEFAATDLIEIAQAGVRLAHQRRDSIQITGSEGAGGVERALIFADHVAASFGDRDGQAIALLMVNVLNQQFEETSRRARIAGSNLAK